MSLLSKEKLLDILDKQFGNDEYAYQSHMGDQGTHIQLGKDCQRDYQNIHTVINSKDKNWVPLDMEDRIFQPLSKFNTGKGPALKHPGYICVYGPLFQTVFN